MEMIHCDDPIPINYIERTADYYSKLGFGKPYEWEYNNDAPFSALKKTLSQSVIGIVTTAAPFRTGFGNQDPGAPYNAGAKFFDVYCADSATPPDLRISHIAIDRDNTSATDLGSYFPLAALRAATKEGRIGEISKRFYGLPTNRSKRTTKEIDCKNLLQQCLIDCVDVAILVPNCPVCHQSVSIAARTLESAGIPCVVVGCAKDIVERVGVSRFLFNDFPLGNSVGRPHDPQSQKEIISLALELFEQATEARTTWQSPLKWIGQKNWKTFYSNPDLLTKAQIAERRAQFEQGKKEAKALQVKTG